MAAIEEVDRDELAKRIDAVIEEFRRQHGRLPRKVQVIAKSDRGQQREWAPTTLLDAVEVTTGSRLVANQLAAQMHREQPHLSFQECVARVFDQQPALYETEIAASQHATAATYDGRSLT
jgi:hypothetical protein